MHNSHKFWVQGQNTNSMIHSLCPLAFPPGQQLTLGEPSVVSVYVCHHAPSSSKGWFGPERISTCALIIVGMKPDFLSASVLIEP